MMTGSYILATLNTTILIKSETFEAVVFKGIVTRVKLENTGSDAVDCGIQCQFGVMYQYGAHGILSRNGQPQPPQRVS